MDTGALGAGVDGLRRAITSQAEDADPDHRDFDAWGGALTEITDRLGALARLLSAQVAAYGSEDTLLRDDEAADPVVRLMDANAHLHDLFEALGSANTAARAYHAAIGHLGIEDVGTDDDQQSS